MNDNFTSPPNAQFILSYELLCLLRWLSEQNHELLKSIISQALSNGLHEEISQLRSSSEGPPLEEMQHSIIDFFTMLETTLLESIKEMLNQKAREKDLMPSIEHIDSSVCDNATVQYTLENVSNHIKDNPDANVKEVLFKELLKHWKPHKNNSIN